MTPLVPRADSKMVVLVRVIGNDCTLERLEVVVADVRIVAPAVAPSPRPRSPRTVSLMTQ